jgi:hypothetical protein
MPIHTQFLSSRHPRGIHITLPLLFLLLITACSDNSGESVHHTHYWNPVWNPDGHTIAYALLEAEAPVPLPSPPPSSARMLLYDAATKTSTTISLGTTETPLRYYRFDLSGSILAILSDGLRFHHRDGSLISVYRGVAGFTPVWFDFTNTGYSFVWIGSAGGHVRVGLTRMDPQTWTPVEERALLDTLVSASALSITLTSQSTYAMRLDDGSIVEMDFPGNVRNAFTSAPFIASNPRQYALRTSTASGGRTMLYALESAGLLAMDLGIGTKVQLIRGGISDFDISPASRLMVYETYSGDVWLATEDGLPLDRSGPHNVMPALSPDGTRLASVARTSSTKDSVRVIIVTN